jgi:hypothetical protein
VKELREDFVFKKMKHGYDSTESIQRNCDIWEMDVSKIDCKAELLSICNKNNILTVYFNAGDYDNKNRTSTNIRDGCKKSHHQKKSFVRNH